MIILPPKLLPPLDPHSEVVDKNFRRWTPPWYSFITQWYSFLNRSYLTLADFGAKGDGRDDTTAVKNAFDTCAANRIQLYGGGPNKNYKIVGRGPQLVDKVVDFDGEGCKFSFYDLPATSTIGGSVGFWLGNSGLAANGAVAGSGTAISVNVAAGDTFITVTSTSGAVVGGLIFVRFLLAATNNPGGWCSVIRGIVGSVIELESPVPVGADLTVGVDTMVALFMPAVTGGRFVNCTMDGANCTNKWVMPLYVQGNIGGRFNDLKFTNWYGAGALSADGAGGPYWESCYGIFINDIETRKAGSAAIASVTTVGVSQSKVDGVNCFDNGFGPEFAWGAFSLFSNVRSVVSRGRGLKTQGLLDCDFNAQVVNQATSNGFGLTLGASFNTYSGIHAVGNDGPSGGNNIWIEGDSNFNRLTNFVAWKHASGQFDIADGAAGNSYINGIVDSTKSVDLLFNGTKWQLEQINGAKASARAVLTLANGANNNIALAEGSDFQIISGPTGAFSISGIANGFDGRRVTIVNPTTQNMTITNDATSTAANRILTFTGADYVSAGQATVVLMYSADLARWIVISANG